MYTHAFECFDISPLLAVTSPTLECGKTTCLMLIRALVPRPLSSSSISTAALFRAVDKYRPTVLIDEADTFLSERNDLRGLLNSGHHRQSAYFYRSAGEDHEPKEFSTWAPKAVAQIGSLHPTLMIRAIHIELRRKNTIEKVEHLRYDRLGNLDPLKRQTARWVSDNSNCLREADPRMPSTLAGRTADNWRPLARPHIQPSRCSGHAGGEVLDVNTMGPLRVTEAFIPHLTRSERKLVVTITSGMGSIGDNTSGGSIPYRSSKAAVNMVMRTVAIDLADRGIISVVINPGWVRTDMGGPNAPLTAIESVKAIRRLVSTLGREQSGKFFNYDGREYPW